MLGEPVGRRRPWGGNLPGFFLGVAALGRKSTWLFFGSPWGGLLASFWRPGEDFCGRKPTWFFGRPTGPGFLGRSPNPPATVWCLHLVPSLGASAWCLQPLLGAFTWYLSWCLCRNVASPYTALMGLHLVKMASVERNGLVVHVYPRAPNLLSVALRNSQFPKMCHHRLRPRSCPPNDPRAIAWFGLPIMFRMSRCKPMRGFNTTAMEVHVASGKRLCRKWLRATQAARLAEAFERQGSLPPSAKSPRVQYCSYDPEPRARWRPRCFHSGDYSSSRRTTLSSGRRLQNRFACGLHLCEHSLLYPCFKTALCYGVVSGCFVHGVSPSRRIRPEPAPEPGLEGSELACRTPESARKIHAKSFGP